MDDSDLLFDADLDLAIIESEQQLQVGDEDFDDDDLDLDALGEIAEVVEQQHAGRISFLSDAEDPPPPPPLSESTPCFHPFDPDSLRTWIYPINYPVRSYQLNIVQKAMFHNTLVALPTGLGKTFIAAVVMFNYYRWFPTSKVIFMAPTRPLVEQQIEACFSICGLPQEDTTDMTGSTSPAKRRELWKSKRVFFATPQTVQKDIETKSCPVDRIACIVVDEAHRATGNYAFSEVVRKLFRSNKEFRVLALTATPGSNLDAVQDVIDNLHITNIQIRTEDSMDLREYSYGKQIERRTVRLDYTEGSTGILPGIIGDFRTKVLLPLLEDLSRRPTGVVPSVERASPWGLRNSRVHFQATCKNLNGGLKFSIIQMFLVAESASRAHDLLCHHGIVPFLDSIEGTFQDFKNKVEQGGKLSKAENAFYHHPALNALVRKCKAESNKSEFVGHPKLEQLTSILLNHFTSLQDNEQSKVMVFSTYRNSVTDICNVLNRHRPIIRATSFVGQASDKSGTKGLKQSEQQDVIQKFKRDEFNVLVSTSIGEEGLDIGELDLIVCFDSQTSPIRMLQRMGRTGRKRKGRCILLLTEIEERKFSQAQDTYERIQRLITRDGLLKYYRPNPSVLPASYKPTICRKKVDVGVYQSKQTSKKRKRAVENSDYTSDGLLRPETARDFYRSFSDVFVCLDQAREKFWPTEKLPISNYMPLQTRLQKTFRVGHSRRTQQFVKLVQKIEHQIIHPNESFHEPQPTVTRFFLPSKVKSKPKPEEIIIKKGKQPEMNEPDFDVGTSLSWEPMLSDHMFEETGSPMMTSFSSIPMEEQFMDMSSDRQSSPSRRLMETSPMETSAMKELTETSKQVMESSSDRDLMEFMGDDEFDDFPIDELFIENIKPDIDPFDDILDPLFPFEKKSAMSDRVTFVFAHEIPKFSEKALTELHKRQERFKSIHGRYVPMKHFEKYQSHVPVKSTIAESNAVKSKSPVEKAIRSPSLEKLESPARQDGFNSPIEEDQFDLDINESMLANFLENKFSDDEGQDFSTFMFEEAPQPSQHTIKKSTLYFRKDEDKSPPNHEYESSDNKTQYHIQQEEEGEPIMVIDFDQSFSDDSEELAANKSEEELHIQTPVVVIESREKEVTQTEPQAVSDENPKTSLEDDLSADDDELPKSSTPEDQVKTNKDILVVSSDDEDKSGASLNVNSQHDSIIIDSSDEENHQPNSKISCATVTPPKAFSPREESESPFIKRRSRKHNRILSEDEAGSPLSLLSLSKGLSPFRASSEEGSPLVMQRRKFRKRAFIEDDDEHPVMLVDTEPTRKRLKQKNSFHEEEEEDEFETVRLSSGGFLQKLRQNGYHQQDENNENPFIDDEAEKSEDGGHTEEEISDGSSLMNSFIDDNSSVDPSSRISIEGTSRGDIYAHALMDSQPLNHRHWMNRFNADKWLGMNEEEDVITEEEEEELENIQDFSSDNPNVNMIDDDDFM